MEPIDTIGEHSDSEYFIPTDEVYWHRDGRRRSFSFGEYIEEDKTFTIAKEIKFKPKGVREIFPVGAIYMSIQDALLGYDRTKKSKDIDKWCEN